MALSNDSFRFGAVPSGEFVYRVPVPSPGFLRRHAADIHQFCLIEVRQIQTRLWGRLMTMEGFEQQKRERR
jgi:hypothetical protein